MLRRCEPAVDRKRADPVICRYGLDVGQDRSRRLRWFKTWASAGSHGFGGFSAGLRHLPPRARYGARLITTCDGGTRASPESPQPHFFVQSDLSQLVSRSYHQGPPLPVRL